MSESAVATLLKVPTNDIFREWRPGSHDWGWGEERLDLITRDKENTETIRQLILTEGFIYANLNSPILLGDDGRVWDGHHRLVIAMEYKPHYLWVDIAGEKREIYA